MKIGKVLASLGFGGLMFGGILMDSALAEAEFRKRDSVFMYKDTLYKDFAYKDSYKNYKAFARSQKSDKITFETEYFPSFYKWTEPQLKEKGIIQRVKFGINVETDNYFTHPKFVLYGGNVDYDGQTMYGNIAVVNNDVTYSGYSMELKGGYKFEGNGNIAVYVAVGLENWNRAINSSLQSNQTNQTVPILGYTEQWSNYYVKVGMAPSKDLGHYYVYGDAYMKMPFKIKNKIKFFDAEVQPKSEIGCGIEIGLGIKHFLRRDINSEIGLFYEYDKFGKSSPQQKDYLGQPIFIYQPESKRELFGMKVGIKF